MPQDRSCLYLLIKGMVKLFYPKTEVVGLENLPPEPAVIVANHAQMHGPIACELYFPSPRYTWCAGEMMQWKEVSRYAYRDFWSHKPKYSRWFYKLLSYVITPFSVCVFNHADTIAVYRDTRIISTFKNTVKRLCEGANVVIFPEHNVPENRIICQFQDRFIDVAKLYYKKTGQRLAFVPMYIAPALRSMHLGKPVYFDPEEPLDQHRAQLCETLMASITEIACGLPAHRVVPYQNLPKKDYPISTKEYSDEKTGG